MSGKDGIQALYIATIYWIIAANAWSITSLLPLYSISQHHANSRLYTVHKCLLIKQLYQTANLVIKVGRLLNDDAV